MLYGVSMTEASQNAKQKEYIGKIIINLRCRAMIKPEIVV